MDEKSLKLVMDVVAKFSEAKTEIEILQKNRQEIYRISRMVPEAEGYKLMALYDDSVKNLSEAWAKLMKN